MTMSDRIAVMRAGKIDQLGSAEELYERPATEFVAGFLGVSNLLAGRVVGAADSGAGGLTEIELSGGRRVRAPGEGLASGEPVKVGVRPEKLRLKTPADLAAGGSSATGDNVLEGVVSDASYIGTSTQYVVQLDDGQDVAVYAQNLETSGVAEQQASGQRVRLTWSPKHTFVIRIGKGGSAPEGGSDA